MKSTILFLLLAFIGVYLITQPYISPSSIYADESAHCAKIVISWIAIIVAIINFFVLIFSPISVLKEIASFEAVRQTVKEQREIANTEQERKEITKTIIKNNKWLAEAKFKAKNRWHNWYYPKEIHEITPIR